VEKLYYGEKLTADEQTLAAGVPQVANKLLGHIPRLEPVLQILSAVNYTDEQLKSLGDGTIGLGARMLSLVLDYDSLVTQGHSADVAVQTLRRKIGRFSEDLVQRFAKLVGANSGASEVREMPLRLVQPGMTILEDLRTHMGTLLVPRGFEVTDTFLEKVRNFSEGMLTEKIKVLVPSNKVSSVRSA
jgi:hypothetical protein